MSDVRWLDADENPWPIPVIDVRPITLGMISTSADPAAAENVLSYGHDDGAAFEDVPLPSPRACPSGLRYRVGEPFDDGALFRPSQMEDKWALFVRGGRLLFVRSWTRTLVVAARGELVGGDLTVTALEGAFADDEPVARTAAVADFIVRSHALREVLPAPLPFDPGPELQRAAIFCFSMYGHHARFATPRLWDAPAPEGVLRTVPVA